ncbi:hypothetical protein [Tunturiibacter lichenicola]|uniref:hypothetical protein n=1 Tax=Tunturiibacter lichenicola TaxID=2051959 RepID=UPI0021B26A93|nr:hypothetical protein [Edaphobacter lichenicola]
MNRISAIALFVAASFVTAGSAMAQDHRIQATVPFNFTVNGESLPAGTYTIGSSVSSPRIITINEREKKVSLMTVTLPDSPDSRTTNKLVFHKYGNQYFLSEIRCNAASMNVHLRTSKQEKWAKAQTQEAALREDNNVLVALN